MAAEYRGSTAVIQINAFSALSPPVCQRSVLRALFAPTICTRLFGEIRDACRQNRPPAFSKQAPNAPYRTLTRDSYWQRVKGVRVRKTKDARPTGVLRGCRRPTGAGSLGAHMPPGDSLPKKWKQREPAMRRETILDEPCGLAATAPERNLDWHLGNLLLSSTFFIFDPRSPGCIGGSTSPDHYDQSVEPRTAAPRRGTQSVDPNPTTKPDTAQLHGPDALSRFNR